MDGTADTITNSGGDHNKSLIPVAKVSRTELKEACQPWKKAIIVKLLDKQLGLPFLKARLLKLWESVSAMEVIDLDNDYFLIRFEDVVDLVHVFNGGPWMVLGHYLIVQRWYPEFFPHEDELKRVTVWVRVPSLPIEYYNKHILWRIGDCLGRTINIDSNTLKKMGVRTQHTQI